MSDCGNNAAFGYPNQQQAAANCFAPRMKKPKLEHNNEEAYDTQALFFSHGPAQSLGSLGENAIANGSGGSSTRGNLVGGDINGCDYFLQQQQQQQQQRPPRDFPYMIEQPPSHQQHHIMIGASSLHGTNLMDCNTNQRNFPMKLAGANVLLTKNNKSQTSRIRTFDDISQEELVTFDAGNFIPENQQDIMAQQSGSVRFRSHQAENWTEKYEELLDYRLRNGHCLVPNAYPDKSLPEWVKRQRYQYKLKGLGKHSTMSDDRIVALEKIGFVWNSHDAAWEERLKELGMYNCIFGDCNVPSNYNPNPQLAVWVKRQRRQYKFLQQGEVSTMTPSRIEKLLALGFAWSGRKTQPIKPTKNTVAQTA
jgi:hypothetical protein